VLTPFPFLEIMDQKIQIKKKKSSIKLDCKNYDTPITLMLLILRRKRCNPVFIRKIPRSFHSQGYPKRYSQSN